MKTSFLLWILQQNVDGIFYDNEESTLLKSK